MIALSLMLASAAEVEVNATAGAVHIGDPSFDIFGTNNALTSLGLGAAVRPSGDRHVPVALVASWQRHQRGRRVRITEADSGGLTFNSAFTTDTFSIGPKIDLDVAEVWAPYVTVQAAAMRGLARFDDDPDDNKSPGQTRRAGIAPGLMVLGGTEFSSPDTASKLEFVCHMEAGYSRFGAIGLGDLGSVRPGGFVLRTGVGMRWGRSGR